MIYITKRTFMIEIIRYLRTISAIGMFEANPGKVVDLTKSACLAAAIASLPWGDNCTSYLIGLQVKHLHVYLWIKVSGHLISFISEKYKRGKDRKIRTFLAIIPNIYTKSWGYWQGSSTDITPITKQYTIKRKASRMDWNVERWCSQ